VDHIYHATKLVHEGIAQRGDDWRHVTCPDGGVCDEPSDCASGACSKEHTLGDYYCCPEIKEGEGGSTDWMGYCNYKCVDAALHKSLCVQDNDGTVFNRVDSQSAFSFRSSVPADMERVQEKWIEKLEADRTRSTHRVMEG
jgi:hypothetical protein